MVWSWLPVFPTSKQGAGLRLREPGGRPRPGLVGFAALAGRVQRLDAVPVCRRSAARHRWLLSLISDPEELAGADGSRVMGSWRSAVPEAAGHASGDTTERWAAVQESAESLEAAADPIAARIVADAAARQCRAEQRPSARDQ
jgi:hypothetical protein